MKIHKLIIINNQKEYMNIVFMIQMLVDYYGKKEI